MDPSTKKRAGQVSKTFAKLYPKPKISLDFKSPLELLVATILSAQCTDERVNIVTKGLFKKYSKAKDYANAPVEQMQEDIRSTGFYKNKTKSILNCCTDIVDKHGGEVPGTMAELVKLAGVGRKTANVILGHCFGVPGVVVDTHVSRVSKRLGFTTEKNAEKIERDLMELLDKKDWTKFSNRMILFGRNTCKARKPQCADCKIYELCPSEEKTA